MTVMDFPTSPTNGQTTTDGRYYFDSSVGSSGAWRSAPLPVGGLPAGSIMAWGTNTPPANWLLADGSAVSRATYSSLFAVIGTQYGAGNGTSTFNLPDLRGRVPVGKNGGTFGTLGATGGAETHTLTVAQMPSHSHSRVTAQPGSVSGKVQIGGGATTADYFWTDPAGGDQPHNNLQPYQVVNYIIKASAGWTAGDSELATRLGVLEQNPNITGSATIAGNLTVNGRIAAPNQPSFNSVATFGASDITAGSLIPFAQALSNKGNCYNTSNSRFTAPITASYLFSFSVYRYSGYIAQPTFRINGVAWNPSDLALAVSGSSTEAGTISLTMVAALSAGDYVDVVQRNTVTARYYGGHSFFMGHLIG